MRICVSGFICEFYKYKGKGEVSTYMYLPAWAPESVSTVVNLEVICSPQSVPMRVLGFIQLQMTWVGRIGVWRGKVLNNSAQLSSAVTVSAAVSFQ